MPVTSWNATLSDELQMYIESFKRGRFKYATEIDGRNHNKQELALKVLTDTNHDEILYGGAAGGAKSFTGCIWELFMALSYPNTRYFVGRNVLKKLMESTMPTFNKVFAAFNIPPNLYRFNGAYSYYQFYNGSRIDFVPLQKTPADPFFENLGSIEYTSGWIEEGGEVCFDAYDTLRSRINRQNNDKYGIQGKLFITCNPKKNWMYRLFYEPWKKGTLDNNKYYIECLVDDNPFVDKGYIEKLNQIVDKVKYERLRKGNWDYEDNPNALCEHDDILAIFDNKLAEAKSKSNNIYLTADIARFGSDYARILVWQDYNVIDLRSLPTSSMPEVEQTINFFRQKYHIKASNCIADEDGIGGGVVDHCGIQGFRNGSSPFPDPESVVPDNYMNLQTQCGYRLADHINKGDIGIKGSLVSEEEKAQIVIELEQLQTYNADSDGRLQLKPKAQIKEDIGRSPDWRDAMLMRMYFDYTNTSIPDDIEERLLNLI